MVLEAGKDHPQLSHLEILDFSLLVPLWERFFWDQIFSSYSLFVFLVVSSQPLDVLCRFLCLPAELVKLNLAGDFGGKLLFFVGGYFWPGILLHCSGRIRSINLINILASSHTSVGFRLDIRKNFFTEVMIK